MKKKGFTYIEVMIAIAIFSILSIFAVELNIAANKNITSQVDRQNMMMEAQKQLEKFKTTTASIGTYVDDNYKDDSYQQIDGYYVVVQSKTVSQGPPTLLEVTIRVRKDITDKNNEVVLVSHFLKS
jgi:prepilin-type N-terminal cleavage/methylation domain-containing protein